MRVFFCLFFAFVWTLFSYADAVFAQTGLVQTGSAAADVWISADILQATLAAKTPEEQNYCNYVIRLRDAGYLPPRIFYGVYKKALSKDRNRRFYYFKYALEAVCKQERIPFYPPALQRDNPKYSGGTFPKMQ
ncbi:MAG: hypothetical protein LBH00_01070 [Planctomycetaceae bacterium]|jgi:hypothetical protein|nr:hypothetical protein [Planctomycetaceae bacterium]